MTGEEFRDLRSSANLTQQGMATAIGMSRKAIVEMEGGRAPIEPRTEIAARSVVDQAMVLPPTPTKASDEDVPLIDAQLCWDDEEYPKAVVAGPGDSDPPHISSFGACDAGWRAMSDAGRIASLLSKAIQVALMESISLTEIHDALTVIPEYRVAVRDRIEIGGNDARDL